MVRGSVHMGGPIVLAWPIFQPRSGVSAGDAMAALPRKWVSGGAPTLPWQTSALQREAGFGYR